MMTRMEILRRCGGKKCSCPQLLNFNVHCFVLPIVCELLKGYKSIIIKHIVLYFLIMPSFVLLSSFSICAKREYFLIVCED